jgi:hypothetical protein
MHVDLDTGFLGLGLGALAGWTQLRRYGWFVAGALLTALGLGEVAGVVVSGAFGAMVSALLVAAGFGAIYVRYPHRSRWALVPAAIFAFFGAVALLFGGLGLVPRLLGSFFLPIVLVGAGGLLLFRHSLPPRALKVGLAVLGGMVLVAAVSSASDAQRSVSTVTMPIDGRTLAAPATSRSCRSTAARPPELWCRCGAGRTACGRSYRETR